MTLDAAAGPMTLARHNLREAIAASATFRTLVGAASVEAARESIYLSAVSLPEPSGLDEGYAEGELAKLLPFAMISTAEYSAAWSSSSGYTDGGQVRLSLVVEADGTKATEMEAERVFENVVDGILADLRSAAVVSGGWAFRRVAIGGGPRRESLNAIEELLGDTWKIDMIFGWDDGL